METEFQAALADRIYKIWQEEAERPPNNADFASPAFELSQTPRPPSERDVCSTIANTGSA